MNYGYCRVSTALQDAKNQEFEILKFCSKKKMIIDEWFTETASGGKGVKERVLGDLLLKCTKGDYIICSELSRIGRSMLMIFQTLNECLERKIQVLTVKEGFELGNNLNSKVISFCYGLVSEIEKSLISQRTKESLARRKSEGMILGRPRGSFSTSKLTGHENEIKELLAKKISICAISRIYCCNPGTVSAFCQTRKLIPDKEKKSK